MNYRAVATCGFGLESVLSFELKKIGAADVDVHDGRIYFSGTDRTIAEANVRLRTAERVLLVLAEYEAVTFDELFDKAQSVDWGAIIDKSDAFPVKGYTLDSMLSSVPACQSIIKKSIVESLKRHYASPFLPESGVVKRVRFSIVKNKCTLMLDTSGDGLHKRGYRPLLNEAPIKETIAAGICDFARIYPESEAADTFCGSGTLLIEAAMRARGIAPGLRRMFAAQEYSFIESGIFEKVKKEAEQEINRDVAFTARGYDIDERAVELARMNAKRAGVSDAITFAVGDARKFKPRENEIILANPPYGERLMTVEETEELYRDFGANLKGKTYKGLYIISNHPEFEKIFGRVADKRRKLYNGMINCQLFMYGIGNKKTR
ncbi:MAG: class I SAM-dependent RNA methyltransferase [Oscillospiraceae bacterium]